MGRFKFLTALGLLLLFTLTAATSSEARNRPRLVDHQDEYSHPWGGDENSGGDEGIVATPVQPNTYNPYRYADGTKSGVVFGAVQFVLDNIETYYLSFFYNTKTGTNSRRGNGATSESITGSTSFSAEESGGKGGK